MNPRQRVMLLAPLAIADVVLVAFVWQRGHTRSPEEPITFAPESREGTSTPDAPRATVAPTVIPNRYVVAVAQSGLIVRAPRVSCGAGTAPMTVDSSNDGGLTFTTAALDVTSVLRLDAVDDSRAVLIGTDETCRVVTYRTADAGGSWTKTGQPAAMWHLLPERDVVHAPGRVVDTPCAPGQLSPIDDEVARLMCSDGRMVGTSNGGTTWLALGRLQDAVSVDYVSTSIAHALAARTDCPAAVLVTDDGGTTWTTEHCAPGRPLALAADGSTVVVMTDQGLAVSTDGGATWTVGEAEAGPLPSAAVAGVEAIRRRL